MTVKTAFIASVLVAGAFLTMMNGSDEDRADTMSNPAFEALPAADLQASDIRPDLACQTQVWFDGSSTAPFDPGC